MNYGNICHEQSKYLLSKYMKSINKMVTLVSEEQYKENHVVHNNDDTGEEKGRPTAEWPSFDEHVSILIWNTDTI